MSQPNNDAGEEDLQKPTATRSQDMLMETLSRRGAAKIAKIDIRERAKRAMLAEAVEDQIFDNTETLEAMLEKDGSLAEANRQQAVEIAQQTKLLQVQYNELVSGNASSVLNAMEAAMGNRRDDNNDASSS